MSKRKDRSGEYIELSNFDEFPWHFVRGHVTPEEAVAVVSRYEPREDLTGLCVMHGYAAWLLTGDPDNYGVHALYTRDAPGRGRFEVTILTGITNAKVGSVTPDGTVLAIVGEKDKSDE